MNSLQLIQADVVIMTMFEMFFISKGWRGVRPPVKLTLLGFAFARGANEGL
jgi:hypothetical protein